MAFEDHQQQQQQQQQGDDIDNNDVSNSNNNNNNNNNSETDNGNDNDNDEDQVMENDVNDNHAAAGAATAAAAGAATAAAGAAALDSNDDNSGDDDDDDDEDDDDNSSNSDGDDDDDDNDDNEVSDMEVDWSDVDEQSGFDCDCDLVENDESESFASDFPLNDDRAIQLGKALIGNTNLEELLLLLGHDMTSRGATALMGGIVGSHIQHLGLGIVPTNNNHEIPSSNHIAQLSYAIRTVERISFLFPVNDHHAACIGECLKEKNHAVKRLLVGVRRLTPGDSGGAMALANGIGESHLTCIDFITKVENQRHDTPIVETMNILYRHGIHHCPTIVYHNVHGNVGDAHALASILPKLLRVTITCANALSVEDAQILSYGFQQSLRLLSVSMTKCELGNQHIHAIAPILGNHPSLKELDLRENNLGDDGISTFVDHWQQESLIDDLNLEQNNIGPVGAQRLIRAMATHSRMRKLNLAKNPTIGYEGVKRIGEELSGKKLLQLNLQGAVNWINYSDATCDNAVLQETKRREAGQALLNGMRGNFYLEQLNGGGVVEEENDGLRLPLHVTAELELYTEANLKKRHLVLEQATLPLAFWSHFLSQKWQTSSFLFLFLRDLHVLMPLRGGGGCGESSPRKRRRYNCP